MPEFSAGELPQYPPGKRLCAGNGAPKRCRQSHEGEWPVCSLHGEGIHRTAFPAGYASNTSAKRYLVKLGKIIQLNLKTELLLLNKPPLTNKIAVEIKYNDSSKKFETVGIVTSSGEELVDNLIKQTVDKALSMNLNMNTNSFSKLQGNPILIIHL